MRNGSIFVTLAEKPRARGRHHHGSKSSKHAVINSDKFFFDRGRILREDLERALVVKHAVWLIQPGIGVGPRTKGLDGMRQDLGVFRYVEIGHRLHPF